MKKLVVYGGFFAGPEEYALVTDLFADKDRALVATEEYVEEEIAEYEEVYAPDPIPESVRFEKVGDKWETSLYNVYVKELTVWL